MQREVRLPPFQYRGVSCSSHRKIDLSLFFSSRYQIKILQGQTYPLRFHQALQQRQHHKHHEHHDHGVRTRSSRNTSRSSSILARSAKLAQTPSLDTSFRRCASVSDRTSTPNNLLFRRARVRQRARCRSASLEDALACELPKQHNIIPRPPWKDRTAEEHRMPAGDNDQPSERACGCGVVAGEERPLIHSTTLHDYSSSSADEPIPSLMAGN